MDVHLPEKPLRWPPRPWAKWTLFALAWSVPAVVFAVLSHARMVAVGEESSFWVWLGDYLVSWYAWAAFSPLIVRLARRHRLDRGPRLSAILIHLALGLVVAVVHSGISVLASVSMHGEPMTYENLADEFVAWLAWRSPWSLVIYWIVLAMTYAYDYYDRAQKEQLRAARLESEIAKAQLDALQRQLHPHFLFNTLNSISVLTQKGDAVTANAVIGQLSDLLRYALQHDGSDTVPLLDEMEFVRRYLAIEQVRFGDRLKVQYDIPDSAAAARVPPFMLQSLVENAIHHGVARKAGNGQIAIGASLEKGTLRLSVEDDGVGLSDGDKGIGSGIGLRNAGERLTLLYGSSFHLELNDRHGGGVRALLEIPAIP